MHYSFILPFLRIIIISQLQRYRLCIASLWKSSPEETSSGANYSFAPKAWLIFKVGGSSLSSSWRSTKKKNTSLRIFSAPPENIRR
uniref:Unclassified n=1 Tax=Fusarium acuminatum CS5907 TaxID=1318461 RepID=W1IC47_9HYPO|nr:unclassified [Fusarium acuminatum CS5907]CDX63554.1 unclassified [Fusarium acuminatum CS5907]